MTNAAADTLHALRTLARNAIAAHPELADQINETLDLAECEIEDGGSESHECEMASSHIARLVG